MTKKKETMKEILDRLKPKVDKELKMSLERHGGMQDILKQLRKKRKK